MACLPWQYVALMHCFVLAETAAVGKLLCHTVQTKGIAKWRELPMEAITNEGNCK